VLQTTAGKMIFGRFIDSATAAQAAPVTGAAPSAAPESEPVRRARPQMPPSAATAGK
jgi:hypothetical protein